MAGRPKLPKADPEMLRWCAALEQEVAGWPRVTTRPMFGLTACYHGKHIFAALPRTRAVDTPFSFLIKLPDATSDRVQQGRGPGGDWAAFAMGSEGDLPDALEQLSRAYERAGAPRRRR